MWIRTLKAKAKSKRQGSSSSGSRVHSLGGRGGGSPSPASSQLAPAFLEHVAPARRAPPSVPAPGILDQGHAPAQRSAARSSRRMGAVRVPSAAGSRTGTWCSGVKRVTGADELVTLSPGVGAERAPTRGRGRGVPPRRRPGFATRAPGVARDHRAFRGHCASRPSPSITKPCADLHAGQHDGAIADQDVVAERHASRSTQGTVRSAEPCPITKCLPIRIR